MSHLKILIDDGLMLARDKPTGIGWYTLSLLRELPASGVEVESVRYSPSFRRLPGSLKRLAYLATSRGNCRRADVDLIHYTNFYVPPRRHRVPVAATIHDLTAFHYPRTLSPGYRGYSRWAIRCAIRYADLLLVPSEAIRREVLDLAPHLPESRIRVVFQDIRPLFFEPSRSDSPRRHFLYVGVLEKRKNLEMLIRTFARFHRQRPAARLVLVGKAGFGYDRIARALAESTGVTHHDYLPDDQLVSLYNQAYALIMPSWYEGFGRPVIEAMAMRLPVIASDIPTNRELHQRHGNIRLFDPADADTLLAHLDAVFSSPAGPLDYGDLGMYRVAEVARRHVEAYQALMAAAATGR